MATTSNLPSPPRGVLLLFLALTGFVGTAGAQVPVVFKVSEGVRPNAIVSLYGEYLTGTPTVRFLRSDGTVAATQTSVQTDRGGHFCRVVFPSILPGAYRLAVSNDAGWSTQAIYVNRADPRWISEERAYPGLQLKLIGRNLDAWEYNGTRNTQVRLVPVDGARPWSSRRTPSTRIASTSPCPLALPPGNTTWKSAPVPPSPAGTGCGWTITVSFPTRSAIRWSSGIRAHQPHGLGLESGVGQ